MQEQRLMVPSPLVLHTTARKSLFSEAEECEGEVFTFYDDADTLTTQR